MSKQRAHRILNAARDGKPVSADEIYRALVATGDLYHAWPLLPEIEE